MDTNTNHERGASDEFENHYPSELRRRAVRLVVQGLDVFVRDGTIQTLIVADVVAETSFELCPLVNCLFADALPKLHRLAQNNVGFPVLRRCLKIPDRAATGRLLLWSCAGCGKLG
jgi:hypothetical protein